MAVCGQIFTVVVTEPGEVWAWGVGDEGQLGLNAREHQLLPAFVAGREVFGARMVMVAAGGLHSAGVTADGTFLTWGRGAEGQLGYGDVQERLRPEQIGRELPGGWSVLMLACGSWHTLVLTMGGLWTCGKGEYGVLGHGDEVDKLMLTQVAAQRFEGNAQIIMVAAGGVHSVGVGAEGGVWTWGRGWCLGHNEMQDRHAPMLLGAVFDGGKTVMVAAGGGHTVAVTSKGNLWAWRINESGQLGTAGPSNSSWHPHWWGGGTCLGGHRCEWRPVASSTPWL